MDLNLMFGKNKFAPFFWTQFLGAFNDNFFKNSLVVLVAFRGIQLLGMDSGSIVAFAGGLFILPFFLFSPLAGQFSDKYEKSFIIRQVKLFEIIIMLIAALGFYLNNYTLLLAVLFLMGAQSTFFGPVKYSLIPELAPKGNITKGTAFIELGTFLAILLGTIAGGLVSAYPGAEVIIGGGLIFVAIIGYMISRHIKESSIGDADLQISYNPISEYRSLWALIKQNLAVFNAIIAISWFWFFGAGVISVLPIYVSDYLMGDEHVVTLFLAMFTIGIGVGSLLCEKLSHQRVEIGIVPIGSIGMSLALIDLCYQGMPWTSFTQGELSINMLLSYGPGWRLLFDFFVMSIFGGIFIVPLYSLLQERSEEKSRSRVIAANNIVNAFFMVIASLMIMFFYKIQLDPVEIFTALALMNIVIAIYMYFVVPEFTLRFYSWIVSRLMYSSKVIGLENIPKEKAFILAANHISFVDWLILAGACNRPVRFVMYYKFFKIPLVRSLMKQAKVIPIAGAKEDLSVMNQAFETIENELRNNNVVCIFPEGRITSNGQLSGFRPGITKMLNTVPVPVVPVVIHGMWGSIFSRKKEKEKPHRRKITVEFLAPLDPTQATTQKLEELIAQQLKEEPPFKRNS